MLDPADVAFRIAGVGHQISGFENLLREFWGLSPARDGDDLVIMSSDAALLDSRKEVLSLRGPLTLKKTKRHKLSAKLIGWIPGQVKDFFEQHGKKFDFNYEEDSALNQIYACVQRLSTCRNEDVRIIIRDELLPFMTDMSADSVCGVAVDITYQGKIYSFLKFGVLIDEYGSSEVEQLVFQSEALSGIVPSPLNLLWYVNTLTRMSPLAFTLAVERGDCAWHFMGQGCFIFVPSVRCEGLFHQFTQGISPVAERSTILPPNSIDCVLSMKSFNSTLHH